MLTEILIAAGLAMFASLSGVLFFSRFEQIKNHIQALISVSVGAFLGVAFIDLIPETLHEAPEFGSFYILGGFLGFIVVSYFISAYHHHHGQEECPECDPQLQETGYLVLLGDLAHNFIDGVVITTSFLVSPAAGIGATIGVLLHEIPQEVAEFFVLVRAGYSRSRALMWNFIVSSSVVFGAIISYFFATTITGAIGPLVGIAAGNLLYIAAADLLPDLFLNKQEPQSGKEFMKQFSLLILGVVLITSLLKLGPHAHESKNNTSIQDRSHILTYH